MNAEKKTETTAQAVPLISVAGLIKQFGRFAALRGVTAEFAAGKFHVILGDNGAGKTTLLRALAGLAQPTRGTISILGKKPREACRDLGLLVGKGGLYGNVIRMSPPLNIDKSDVDEAIRIMDQALTQMQPALAGISGATRG